MLKRNTWGAIISGEGINKAQEILCDAILAGKLDESYCDVDRKHRGSALNYDIYDFSEGVVLIQQRVTTCTKYGNSPKKDYYLLIKTTGGIAKIEAPHKMSIARASKLGLPVGAVIQKICGTSSSDDLFARFVVAPKMGVKS